MLIVNERICLGEDELEFQAIRAQGAGGQNVNKVSSAVHLRFASQQSSLPDWLKQRLLQMPDPHITRDGLIIIKAQRFRSQGQNRADALTRLAELLANAAHTDAPRRSTKPTFASKKRRLEAKGRRSEIKAGRSRVFL